LRITGGRYKGQSVETKGSTGVRPTSSRVREALFSMLGQDLSGERVLDAFGGSGLLGLEAASRGADVVIVEKHPRNARLIQGTVRRLKAPVKVVTGDSTKLVEKLGPFDGVLADPPYALDHPPILETLAETQARWIVYEAPANTAMPSGVGELVLISEKRFGDTTLYAYGMPR